MEELISIIIPVFNVEPYLSRCINSVLKQTYQKLEIILVDDGSPDRCGEICDEFAELDARVKVIHKQNGGVSDSRNTGLDNAQGLYISFLDSDDWIHEEYVETLYHLLINSNSDVSTCSFIKTKSENIKPQASVSEIFEYSNIEALREMTGQFYVMLVVPCCKLYKRALFEGIRYPTGRLHEDEFTTYKLIYKAKKIVLITEALYFYLQRETSIMGTRFNIKNRLDLLDAYEERARFFQSCGLTELSDETYKALFFMSLESDSRVRGFFSSIDTQRKVDFKKNLRNSNQQLKTKILYEIYFIAPIIACCLFSMYTKLKKSKYVKRLKRIGRNNYSIRKTENKL